MSKMLKQFFDIKKVDEEQRMVYGYASTEAVDLQGEIVSQKAMMDAWDDYMKFANVREMHGNSAAGVVKEATFDDKGVYIGAKIVDDSAWNKVVEGVYKGFSIGGKKLKGGYDAVTKTITALRLTEISLVDRPANPEALIEMFKADGTAPDEEQDETVEFAPENGEPESSDAAAQKAASSAAIQLRDDATQEELEAALAKMVAEQPALKAAIEKMASKPQETKQEAPKESALRKSFAALAAAPEDVEKGLYCVSYLADILSSLSYLQSDVAWEAEYEGDGSTLPKQLADLVAQTGAVLLAMAEEEIGEMIAALKLPEGTPAITVLNTAVERSAYAADLKKHADVGEIFKAGARNSAADAKLLQQAHDILSNLGAECISKSEVNDVDMTDKHEHNCDLEKMAGELGELRKVHDDLVSQHDTLKKAHETLRATYNALPKTPKAILKTVGKEDDVDPSVTKAVDAVQPVLKADGSVDEVATEMKKVHAGGGRALFR